MVYVRAHRTPPNPSLSEFAPTDRDALKAIYSDDPSLARIDSNGYDPLTTDLLPARRMNTVGFECARCVGIRWGGVSLK